MERSFFFSTIILLCIGCASGQQKQVTQSEKVNLFKRLGNDIDSIPNTSGQFVLYVQKINLTARNPVVKAIVLEVSTNQIVSEFSYTPGYSKWKTETEIEVFNAPGTIRKEEDVSKFITVIQLKSNKIIP